MRTIEVKIYKFAELSEEAKEFALNTHQNEFEFHWGEEASLTLLRGVSLFGFVHTKLAFHWGDSSMCRLGIEYDGDSEPICTGEELKELIQINFGKVYNPQFDKVYNLLDGDCPFTGMGYDEDFLDPVREFMENPTQITLKELLEECIKSVFMSVEEEINYMKSLSGYIEHCEGNEVEFYENGVVYNG